MKVNRNTAGALSIPWWTWILPFFIANLGTWLSVWFKTDPGASLWYLPTALGIVMVYWWGPRVLLGVYLNAVVCAPLWDLPWQWSFLYALPETMEVGLSWLFFIKTMRGKCWLPDLGNVGLFLVFGSLLPTFISNVYLVTQLFLLGDIPENTIWDNWRIIFSGDLTTQFVLAVPLLVLFTKPMSEKGWTQIKDAVPHWPLLPANRNSLRDILFIMVILGTALIAILAYSIHDLWILYGFLMILIAIRYGVNMAVIGTSWIGILAFLLPVILTGKLGLATATYGDFVSTNFDILFLCGVTLLTGRAISDLFVEITERKQAEEALRDSEEKFSVAFRSSPIGLVIATMDGKYVEVNQAFCDLLGYSRENLLGKTAVELEIFNEGTRQAWVKAVEREGGAMINVELSFRARNGTSRTTLSSVETIILQGIPHRLSTVLDITERKGAEETIRKSEQVLREAEELGHTGSWEQNLVTGEIFNTEENLRLFFGDDHSKGADFEDYAEVVHPDDREYVMQRRVQLLTERGPSDIEYRVVWPDGSIHVLFGRATVVYDELDQAIRVYGTNVDITERKRAEEDIRSYAARMAALVEISRAFVEVGLEYQNLLNTVARRTAELIGDSCVITLFSEDNQRAFPVAFHHRHPKALALMEEALLHIWQGRTDTERFRLLLAGDSIYIPVVNPAEYRAQSEPEFWPYLDAVGVSSVLIVPLKAQGRVIGTLGITRDSQGDPYTRDDQILLQNVTDRAAMSIQNAQLFTQVEGAREQLGALSRRLLEVQESERRALTTELHDRVGQNLTGLSIILQNIKAMLPDEMAKIFATKFDDAQLLVEDAARQIRDIMAELHLPELEDYGLAAALETYAERVASRGNLELIADLLDLAPPRLPSDVRIALFRAAQEAISNVLKHANATQLEVSLDERNGSINLTIEDNGQGFEPDTASQKTAQTWGLKIMHERIESIGGKVQIESQLGEGTRVTFEMERPS